MERSDGKCEQRQQDILEMQEGSMSDDEPSLMLHPVLFSRKMTKPESRWLLGARRRQNSGHWNDKIPHPTYGMEAAGLQGAPSGSVKTSMMTMMDWELENPPFSETPKKPPRF